MKMKTSKLPPPGWPTEADWKNIDRLLEKAPATKALPPNAGPVERFKFELCVHFVIYLREHDLSQRELAKKLKTTEARVSEIVHYHLDKVTTDRLIGYLAVLKPGIKIRVAS